MNLKYKILSAGIALWLVAFIQMISSYQEKINTPALADAFAANHFSDTISIVTATGSYNNSLKDSAEREAFLSELAAQLGITTGLVYDSYTKNNVLTSALVQSSEHGNTTLKLITTKNKEQETAAEKNLLSIEIEFENSLESAFYYKDILKNLLDQKQINSDISICLQGIIPGEISLTDKNVLADKLISEAGGTIVTESRTDNLFTIYAYTDAIKDYTFQGSMKTNLNVIISYDEIENHTIVSFSTPFLNKDF